MCSTGPEAGEKKVDNNKKRDATNIIKTSEQQN